MAHKDLWSAVLLQALHDIEALPYGCVDYESAVAFFLAPGDWSHARQAIADAVDQHVDDVVRIGLQAVNKRRRAEGLVPVDAPRRGPKPKPLPKPSQRPKPILTLTTLPLRPRLPRLEAIPAPPAPPKKRPARPKWGYDPISGQWRSMRQAS